MGERVVYGARCMWWGLISEAGKTASGLPVTPCCSSPMFEMENEQAWWEGVDSYEKSSGQRGYRQFIEWLRGRCYPTIDAARDAYYAEGHARP